ncbi:hypothetical protein NQ317_008898 [Molorchus minor]|uniref:HD domain-containing protein n=1 Tax=Molorchus minor TaxID=1323400 RepID=A0ABQ9IXK4_9CUCU|nr:hypothetical protein NQ317_008898 [Molorchus minor]
MGTMTFLLGNNSTLDRFKCLQLALVQDLAECTHSDITPKDNIPEDKKHAMEDEAMKELTAHVGSEIGPLIYNLYKEYEAKETPEAKFVKDLDRDNTPNKLQEFFDGTKGKFKHPYIASLVDVLEQQRKQQRPPFDEHDQSVDHK